MLILFNHHYANTYDEAKAYRMQTGRSVNGYYNKKDGLIFFATLEGILFACIDEKKRLLSSRAVGQNRLIRGELEEKDRQLMSAPTHHTIVTESMLSEFDVE